MQIKRVSLCWAQVQKTLKPNKIKKKVEKLISISFCLSKKMNINNVFESKNLNLISGGKAIAM